MQRARVTQLFGGDLPVSVFSVVESRVDMDSGMVPSGIPPDTCTCDYEGRRKKREREGIKMRTGHLFICIIQ